MHVTTSSATMAALRPLFASYGLPVELVSDNGPQFVSEELKNFLKVNGVLAGSESSVSSGIQWTG